ncbi:hypothetical protein ACX80H_10885 [Arthrobacter sp. MDT2-2]
MRDTQQTLTQARPKGDEKAFIDKVMYALCVATLCAFGATLAFLAWEAHETRQQNTDAYVQAVEDTYGVEVDKRIAEGQVRLTGETTEGGLDHCFGPEEYRVAAESVDEPDSLLCFDRDRYRDILRFVESEGGEIIGGHMGEDTLAVVFKDDGPFGISCTVPEPDDTELHCAW